jgi:hypothetical protein
MWLGWTFVRCPADWCGTMLGTTTKATQSPRQMVLSLTRPEDTNPNEDPTMDKLKTEVAERLYTVDSALVAEEILRKLRMVKWARHELVSEPGRSHQQKLRGL